MVSLTRLDLLHDRERESGTLCGTLSRRVCVYDVRGKSGDIGQYQISTPVDIFPGVLFLLISYIMAMLVLSYSCSCYLLVLRILSPT